MKRFLALALAITMILCLVGCNKSPDKPGETEPEKIEEIIDNNTPVETKPVDIENIPEDQEDLNNQEIEYVRRILSKALLTLDLETLQMYITEDNYKVLEEISNDATKKEVFLKTIGASKHMEDSNFIMVRSTAYTYSKWYTDMKQAGTLPSTLDALTDADIENIYNNYYLTAPYQLILLNEGFNGIEDGAAQFNIVEAIMDLGIYDINSLNTDNMLVYMFGQTACDNYSTTTAVELSGLNQCFVEGMDANKIYEYIQTKYPDYNNPEEPIKWLTDIEPQLGDEDTRKKINKWAADNMDVYTNNYEIAAFIPLDFKNMMADDSIVTDTFYGQYMNRLTKNDIAILSTHTVIHPLTTDGRPITFFQFTNNLVKILLAADIIN